MVQQSYLAAIRDILTQLEQTQLPALEATADLVVHALTHQGVVYCAEIGYGIQGDFIHRAGGLSAVQHFPCKLDLTEKAPQSLNRQSPDRDLETIRFAVQTS